MVTLVVATTIDPASIGPASALLSMPGWYPSPLLQNMSSFTNRAVRLLKHDKSIEATGEVVDEVIFLSKHTATSNRPALTVHPIGTKTMLIGMPHLRQDEVPPAGGKPGWAAPPNPRIGPWLWLLKAIAESHNLTPEFEVTLEATHHGPEINSPTMFVEIDLGQSKQTNVEGVGGTWREAIKVACETTKAAFPGGEVMAHLDHKPVIPTKEFMDDHREDHRVGLVCLIVWSTMLINVVDYSDHNLVDHLDGCEQLL
ncbi:D-aminoacyl-tRNA deacylase [Camellia lanceoleosa]|uniref:D-aminoacyl-tRNA deacylase n=1 Tax=Camellia lanceoleosa TaxID=1840588 RepID=A0ACC0FCV7_9ERIC|nr:D-aminoacyl-tRNA deacylase [Camellia lanceoleosa]